MKIVLFIGNTNSSLCFWCLWCASQACRSLSGAALIRESYFFVTLCCIHLTQDNISSFGLISPCFLVTSQHTADSHVLLQCLTIMYYLAKRSQTTIICLCEPVKLKSNWFILKSQLCQLWRNSMKAFLALTRMEGTWDPAILWPLTPKI